MKILKTIWHWFYWGFWVHGGGEYFVVPTSCKMLFTNASVDLKICILYVHWQYINIYTLSEHVHVSETNCDEKCSLFGDLIMQICKFNRRLRNYSGFLWRDFLNDVIHQIYVLSCDQCITENNNLLKLCKWTIPWRSGKNWTLIIIDSIAFISSTL